MRYLKISLFIAALVAIFFILPSSGDPLPVDSYPLSFKSTLGYVKFDGVEGEVQEQNHVKWSEILTFTTRTHAEGSEAGTSRRRGSVTFDDIVIMKEIDKASPKIMEACTKRKVFPKVEIHITGGHFGPGSQSPPPNGMSNRMQSLNNAFQGGGGPNSNFVYLKWELKNATVTSHGIDNSSNRQGILLDCIALEFEEIKCTYTELDDTGKVKGNIEFDYRIEKAEND